MARLSIFELPQTKYQMQNSFLICSGQLAVVSIKKTLELPDGAKYSSTAFETQFYHITIEEWFRYGIAVKYGITLHVVILITMLRILANNK